MSGMRAPSRRIPSSATRARAREQAQSQKCGELLLHHRSMACGSSSRWRGRMEEETRKEGDDMGRAGSTSSVSYLHSHLHKARKVPLPWHYWKQAL